MEGRLKELDQFIEDNELELEIYAENGYEKSDLVAMLLRCHRSN